MGEIYRARLAQFVHAPIRIDAIVGLDLLRLESVTLDYRARKVIFGVPSRLKRARGMESKLPYLSVKANIGGHTVRLLVDTGATEWLCTLRVPIYQLTERAVGSSK